MDNIVRKKISYLWDYYKVHLFVILFFLLFFFYFLVPLFDGFGKDTLLSIAIIDSSGKAKNDTSELSNALMTYLDCDEKKDRVLIDTSGTTADSSSSSTIKVTILLSAAGENDIVICNQELYEKFNAEGAFLNLDAIAETLSADVYNASIGTAVDLTGSTIWNSLGYTDYTPVYACIPVSCKNPARAALFLNYLYSKEDLSL